MPQLDLLILYNQVIFVTIIYWVLYFLNIYLFLFNINKSLKIKKKILYRFMILDNAIKNFFFNYNLKNIIKFFINNLIINFYFINNLYKKILFLKGFFSFDFFFKNINFNKYNIISFYNNIYILFFIKYFINKIKNKNINILMLNLNTLILSDYKKNE